MEKRKVIISKEVSSPCRVPTSFPSYTNIQIIRFQMLANVTDAIFLITATFATCQRCLHTAATQCLIQRNHALDFGKAVRHL